MAYSYWRLYDTQHETEDRVGEYLMHEDTTWGLGHEFQGARAGLTVDTTWLKTEVTRLCCKAKYRQNTFDIKKIPEGTSMGLWKEKPKIAEHIGCVHFFVKYSKDARYRIELEVNSNV